MVIQKRNFIEPVAIVSGKIFSTLLLVGYLGALYIANQTHVVWPLNIIGFLLLMFWLPYSIVRLFRISFSSIIELVLMEISLYFALITPIVYFLNRAGLSLTISNIYGLLLIMFALQYFFPLPQKTVVLTSKKLFAWGKDNAALILTLVLFSTLHSMNFQFYKFIPEGDGYLDIVQIQKTIQTGTVEVGYRYFFNTSVAFLSIFTSLPPYALFSAWVVGLQSTLIVSIYLVLKKYHITHTAHQALILIAALAVPVINMEIDYVRPQTIMVILLPIYIYVVYQAIQERRARWWGLATLMCVAGIGYHQFFLMLITTHCALGIATFYFQTYLFYDKKTKINAGLLGIIILLIAYIGYQKALIHTNVTITSTAYYTGSILKALKFSNWHWWFLDSYGNGSSMGWKGLLGAISFYAYYTSPVIVVTFLATIISLIKHAALRRDTILFLSLPALGLFFFFAEIIPRFNRPLVPERFWLLLDIYMLFLLIPITKYVFKLDKGKKIITGILLIAIASGIAGSFYIAYNKREAIVSYNDVKATAWIKTHTPPNATFITQTSNDALFAYYFNRPVLTRFPMEEWATSNFIQIAKAKVTYYDQHPPRTISCTSDMSLQDIQTCVANIYAAKNDFLITNPPIEQLKNALQKPLYVYYSTNRFHNIFAQRQWWQEGNYFNIDLSKLDSLYTRVYDQDGVFIWEVQ